MPKISLSATTSLSKNLAELSNRERGSLSVDDNSERFVYLLDASMIVGRAWLTVRDQAVLFISHVEIFPEGDMGSGSWD